MPIMETPRTYTTLTHYIVLVTWSLTDADERTGTDVVCATLSRKRALEAYEACVAEQRDAKKYDEPVAKCDLESEAVDNTTGLPTWETWQKDSRDLNSMTIEVIAFEEYID